MDWKREYIDYGGVALLFVRLCDCAMEWLGPTVELATEAQVVNSWKDFFISRPRTDFDIKTHVTKENRSQSPTLEQNTFYILEEAVVFI